MKYNLWFLSDEAYRELFYLPGTASSIWHVTEKEVPGIRGRRISIESASKVWNACGLRIGALVSDNREFHERAVAENTANLCPNVMGQYIFGALFHESKDDLQAWFSKLRDYYREMSMNLAAGLQKEIPGLIVSHPDASLYTVIDFRNILGSFSAKDFVMFCAQKGSVLLNGVKTTLLTAPMEGFYSSAEAGKPHPGRMQLRIAYVEPPSVMAQVPELLAKLLRDFLQGKK